MKVLNTSYKDIFIVIGTLLIASPIFFDIYRTAAFSIIPHDDYVPYLLYFLGEEGGFRLGNPSGYRIFSVLLAYPFYHILPLYKFTLLQDYSDIYLKGLQALSFVNYLAISFGSFFIYKITKKHFRGDELTSLLSLLLSILIFRFTAIYGVDPIEIAVIALLILNIKNKLIFTLILTISIGFNEKIVFLFIMLFGARSLFLNTKQYYNLGASTAVFALYFFVRAIVNLPGYEYMVQPQFYFEKASHTIGLLFTPKSIYLNLLPFFILIILYSMAKKALANQDQKSNFGFTKIDILPLIGFFIITLLTGQQYNIGRILLFTFPLYLPLATVYIGNYLKKGS